MSRNIVITSGKGGVGKSSVTAYLGVELCRQNHRVLLIDMDEGLRSLDLMLGTSEKTVFDLSDVLCGRCETADAILPVDECDGLRLLPAPSGKGNISDKYALRNLCNTLKGEFDFILIDCPAGIGDGFYCSVYAANEALLVVNPDPVCVRDGQIVSRLLRQSGIDSIRLVINKLNTRLMKKGTFLNIDEIIDGTGTQLIAAIPTDDEIIKAAANSKPLPDCFAKDAFSRLSLRLNGKNILLPKLEKFT